MCIKSLKDINKQIEDTLTIFEVYLLDMNLTTDVVEQLRDLLSKKNTIHQAQRATDYINLTKESN